MRHLGFSTLRVLFVLSNTSCMAQPREGDDAGVSDIEATPFTNRVESIGSQAAINDSAAFSLTYTADTAAAYVDMLTASMSAVIDDGLYGLGSRAAQCGGAKGSAQPSDWYCFDDVDVSSWKDPDVENAWIPQGMTTVSDSLADESWNGRSAMIVGWYHKGPSGDGPNGIRISVINTVTGDYRHVLLVDPYFDGSSHVSYSPIKIHAGGLLWYGRYLFVPDTNNGIRVFSMDYIYDLGASTNGTTSCSYIGYQAATYCAASYKYVLPQIGRWDVASPITTTADYCNPDSGKARFSYISVDRPTTPDRLVVGEFCESTQKLNGRLATYSMADAVPDSGATTLTPQWVKTLPSKQVQGAAYNGVYWYLNKSNGSSNGSLLQTVESGSTFSVNGSHPTPIGPEDLSFWQSTGQVWSVTEYLNPGRMIYSMPTNF